MKDTTKAYVRIIGDVVGMQFSSTTNGYRTFKNRKITDLRIESQAAHLTWVGDKHYYTIDEYFVGKAKWNGRELDVRCQIIGDETEAKWFNTFKTYNPSDNAKMTEEGIEHVSTY